MKKEIKRNLGGEECICISYGGKMRLYLEGCFDTGHGENPSDQKAPIPFVEPFPDGSISASYLRLIPDNTTESEIEDMMDRSLTQMEAALGLDSEVHCSSSSWHAGHSESDKDHLLSQEEQNYLAAYKQSPNENAQ